MPLKADDGGKRRHHMAARVVRALRDRAVDVLQATVRTAITASSEPGSGSGNSSYLGTVPNWWRTAALISS
jgi:hypothetical protein